MEIRDDALFRPTSHHPPAGMFASEIEHGSESKEESGADR